MKNTDTILPLNIQLFAECEGGEALICIYLMKFFQTQNQYKMQKEKRK